MNNKMKRYDRRDQGYFPSLSRYFDTDFFKDMSAGLPAANVTEKERAYDVALQVPGFDKTDIHLEVDKNILKISGEHTTSNDNQSVDEEGNLLRQEFSMSSFSRSFVLPENVDTEKITATQKDGVLTIELPKLDNAKEEMVRKIEIK